MPVFWSGLILPFIFSVKLGFWISPGSPTGGSTRVPRLAAGFRALHRRRPACRQCAALFFEALTHLILPAFVLGWSVTGILTHRLIRSSLLETLNMDYIRTARRQRRALKRWC